MKRMKKAELLAGIPEKLPEECTAKILKTSGGRVLMVVLSFWQRSVQVHRWMAPSRGVTGIVHFVWKDGWLTYYPELKHWTKESLDWIEFRSVLRGDDLDEDGRKAVREYTGRLGGLYDVSGYEIHVKIRMEGIRVSRKQMRINAMMRKVEPLPAGFKGWCTKKLQAAGGKQIHVKLFQKFGENAVERIFTVTEGTYGVFYTEVCRAFTDGFGTAWISWYYGQKRNEAGARQEFWPKKNRCILNNLPKRPFVYDRNLESIGLDPAERSVLRCMDGYADPADVLYWLHSYPAIEMPVKAGLRRYVVEAMGAYEPGVKMDRMKCLPAPQLKRLAEHDGGMDAWKVLVTFPKVTEENLKEICRIRDGEKMKMVLQIVDRGLNLNHVFTLLRQSGGIKIPVLRKYTDYLEMAEQRGSSVGEEVIYRNKRWEHFHDRYVEERNRERERLDKKENRAKWQKWKAITKDWKRNKRIFAWEGGGYVVVVPRTPEEINEEGRRQHHCVGAQDQYKTKMAVRESYILFLRHAETPEEPYYTIEATEQKVLQAYGAYDRKPDEDVVDRVLSDWMKQVRKNARAEKKLEEAGR